MSLPDGIWLVLDQYEYRRRLRDLGDAWAIASWPVFAVAYNQVWALWVGGMRAYRNVTARGVHVAA